MREQRHIETLAHEAQRITRFLAEHRHDKTGARGAVRKSNVTDNDSAKMATDKGVVKDYCGVATVDAEQARARSRRCCCRQCAQRRRT